MLIVEFYKPLVYDSFYLKLIETTVRRSLSIIMNRDAVDTLYYCSSTSFLRNLHICRRWNCDSVVRFDVVYFCDYYCPVSGGMALSNTLWFDQQ